MKRSEKQQAIAKGAEYIARQLETSTKETPFTVGTGYEAVPSFNKAGNLVGSILVQAGFGRGRNVRGMSSYNAVAHVLGVASYEVPSEVIQAVVEIEDAATSPANNGYARRVQRLARVVRAFGKTVAGTPIGKQPGRPRTEATTSATF